MEIKFVSAPLLPFLFFHLQHCIRDQWEQSTSPNRRQLSLNMRLITIPLLIVLSLAIMTHLQLMSYNHQETMLLKTMTTLHPALEMNDVQTSTPTLKLLLKTQMQLLCGGKMMEHKRNQWEHLLHHLHLHQLLQTLHYLLECRIPPCDYVPKMGAHMWLYALKLLKVVLDIRIKHIKSEETRVKLD